MLSCRCNVVIQKESGVALALAACVGSGPRRAAGTYLIVLRLGILTLGISHPRHSHAAVMWEDVTSSSQYLPFSRGSRLISVLVQLVCDDFTLAKGGYNQSSEWQTTKKWRLLRTLFQGFERHIQLRKRSGSRCQLSTYIARTGQIEIFAKKRSK